MTFKEFSKWLRNEKNNDGSLSTGMLLVCFGIFYDVNNRPTRIRERYWRRLYEDFVMERIFNSMNKEAKS